MRRTAFPLHVHGVRSIKYKSAHDIEMNSVRRFRCPKFGARVQGVQMHIYRALPILYRPEIEIDDFFHNVGATQPPLSWCVRRMDLHGNLVQSGAKTR